MGLLSTHNYWEGERKLGRHAKYETKSLDFCDNLTIYICFDSEYFMTDH